MKRLFAALTIGVVAGGAAAQEKPLLPLALQGNFPKAVHYRYANNFKLTPGSEDAAYRTWVAEYGGVMGAELDRRVADADDGRREVIQRFKREHPEQFLIFYSTGHIKIPTDKTDPASGKLSDYSHGHWLYLPRVRVLGNVPQESGETTLRVEMRTAASTIKAENAAKSLDDDAAGATTKSVFSLRPDRGDDICLYALAADGQADWENAEQVTLIGFDEKAGMIRVRRGCYGSQPRAFRGQVFAAVHAEVVKFHGWLYNFSTFCPRDREGRTAGDIWAAAYARNFQPGGRAAHFDALQHDTLTERVFPARGVDLNNNGIDDSEERLGGVNWFAVGLCQALEKLRAALPPDKLLVPDAANRGFFQVNGWEVEGFPGRSDPGWREYSSLCNQLEFARHFCQRPRYTHVQHKIFNYTLGRDGPAKILGGKDLPFHLSRAVLGLATVHEAAVTWYSQPPPEPDGRHGVYDEIRMGQAGKLGWLGKPLGEPLYPARSSPDLCANVLSKPGRIVVENGSTVEHHSDGLHLSHADKATNARAHLQLASTAPDLLVCVRLRGMPRVGVAVRMPRALFVAVSGDALPASYLLPYDGTVAGGLLLRDGSTKPLQGSGGTRIEFNQGFHALRLWAKSDEAVAAFWQVQRWVPADGRLSFWAFRGKGAYRVEAAERHADGTLGPFHNVVTPLVPSGPAGFERNIALAPTGLAGKAAVFRFLSETSKGKAESLWAEPSLGSPDAGDNLSAGPVRLQSSGWFCEEPVTQFFHFHHLPTGVPLDVALECEGGEEVVIESVTAHAAPGAIAREFENGLVLVNPSPRPYTFDLSRFFPGRRFRRLVATSAQDTATNNGQPVGATVTLGNFDGLFLVKEQARH